MKLWISALFVLLLSACSTQFQAVTQVDDKAYLQLSGNFIGSVLQLNNQPPISLADGNVETFNLNGATVAKFELSTGSHQVQVTRDGQVLVKRTLFVSQGNTIEVRVP